MGTSRSVEQFADKINGLARTTTKRQEQIVRTGADATKRLMLATASARGVKPSGKLAGKSWNVRYDLTRGATPSALVRFTGPFHLVNNNTAPHEITPRASRGRRGKKALRIGNDLRASASHPGTRGKRIFQTGREAAGKTVPKAMAAQMVRAWHEGLR